MSEAVVLAVLALLSAAAGGILSLFGTRKTARVAEKVAMLDGLQKSYDQLQEDLEREREYRALREQQIAAELIGLRAEISGLRVDIMIWEKYADSLRRHIYEGMPPPPPPWPTFSRLEQPNADH